MINYETKVGWYKGNPHVVRYTFFQGRLYILKNKHIRTGLSKMQSDDGTVFLYGFHARFFNLSGNNA